MGVIYYNGVPSTFYGIQVETQPGYLVPEKDVEIIHIPGRNGDLIIDKGIYQNVDREYAISMFSNKVEFDTLSDALTKWLHPKTGYSRLEDSYDPEHFRMAIYKDDLSIENILAHGAKATLVFNCKPQRYLKTGDTKLTISESGSTVVNPTNQIALPLITVRGSGTGTVMIGRYEIQLSRINEYVTLDSELQDAFKGSENKNADVTLPDGYPKLPPGATSITFSGGITSVEITPRWWTL